MCKYCEPQNNTDLGSNLNHANYGDATYINTKKRCLIIEADGSYPWYEIEIPINICPICGRKL